MTLFPTAAEKIFRTVREKRYELVATTNVCYLRDKRRDDDQKHSLNGEAR